MIRLYFFFGSIGLGLMSGTIQKVFPDMAWMAPFLTYASGLFSALGVFGWAETKKAAPARS